MNTARCGLAFVAALRGRRLLPLCVAWFWIFLLPSVALPLNVVMNEHRLYLPGGPGALVEIVDPTEVVLEIDVAERDLARVAPRSRRRNRPPGRSSRAPW